MVLISIERDRVFPQLFMIGVDNTVVSLLYPGRNGLKMSNRDMTPQGRLLARQIAGMSGITLRGCFARSFILWIDEGSDDIEKLWEVLGAVGFMLTARLTVMVLYSGPAWLFIEGETTLPKLRNAIEQQMLWDAE